MTQMESEAPMRTETFDCPGPAELVLFADAGRIDVRLVDGPDVRVTVSAERGEPPVRERGFEGGPDHAPGGGQSGPGQLDEDDAQLVRETTIRFSAKRRRLVVRTPRALRRSRLALVVDAPLRSAVVARTHRGSATISGEASSLNAATGVGDVTADRIDGKADVRTGKGDLRLGRVTGRLSARSGSGELEVASIEGDGAKLATGRGDVWLGVVRGDVQVRTGRGSVEVAEAGSGRVDLLTGSGDLRVAIRPGVAAEVDLYSGSGQARSELEVSDRPPANVPLLRIRGRTSSGDVLVQPVAADC